MSDLNYVIGNQGQTTAVAVYPTTIQSATITTSGFPVQITVTGDGEPAGAGWHRIQFYRNNTPIGEILHAETTGAGKNVAVAMSHIDTPVAGTYTYKVNVVGGSGVSIKYTEVGQLSMIVEEKIISSYFANNWLRRDINPPDVYYGYSTDYNATDSDPKWSIKKVTVAGTVETVTWTNGNPKSAVSKWDGRIDCFNPPVGPINLIGNVVTVNGGIILQLSWTMLSGVDSYQIIVAESVTGKIFTDGGYILYNNGSNSMFTYEVFNKDYYNYTKPEVGKLYDVTVIALNVAGNVTETVKIEANPKIALIITAFKSRVAAASGTFEAESCLNTNLTSLVNSGLFEKASLIITPNAYKASKIYVLKPTDGSGDLTFSRASAKRRRNASGVLEALANNVPALEYPVGGSCPAWLFEPQRTNELVRSCEMENAAWTKSACSVLANSATSPDGTSNADKIVEDGTTNIHGVYQIKNVSGQYTYSFYAKAGERDKVAFLTNAVGGVDKYIFFDLTNLTIHNAAAGLTGRIEDVGNGWRRISVTFTGAGITTYYFMQLASNSLSSAVYAGNGSSGVYMWQAQLEVGAYATSPIITAGSSVTRLPDLSQSSSVTGITSTSFTFYAYISSAISTSSGSQFLGVSEDASNYGLWLFTDAVNTSRLRVVSWTSSGLVEVLNIADGGDILNSKVALQKNGMDIKIFKNGVLIKTVTLTVDIPVPTRLQIFGGSCILRTKDILTFNSILTDAECIALTTP